MAAKFVIKKTEVSEMDGIILAREIGNAEIKISYGTSNLGGFLIKSYEPATALGSHSSPDLGLWKFTVQGATAAAILKPGQVVELKP
jgi:hypothetical protein